MDDQSLQKRPSSDSILPNLSNVALIPATEMVLLVPGYQHRNYVGICHSPFALEWVAIRPQILYLHHIC